MLVERGLQVLNVEIIGEAYAIAANFLRRSGAIPNIIATDERLLALVVDIFHGGESNRLKLANRAIARFQTRR